MVEPAPLIDLEGRLLYRDGLMLIINKPAGMACHKGPQAAFGTHDNLEAHFGQLQFGLPNPPALAHRLDRDTSGCLVLGRHRKALEKLGDLFKKGLIDKTYWAVVEGGPQDDEGLIDLSLGRKDPTRGWWMKVDPAGLLDFPLVAQAIIFHFSRRGVAHRNMDVFLGNVHMIEKGFPHPTVVAVGVHRAYREIFVQVEGYHPAEIQTFLPV